MRKINTDNIIINVETIDKNSPIDNKKKVAIEAIETSKKIPVANQDYKKNKTIKKMLISKSNSIKNNLIAKTKKTTTKTTDLTNRISQVRQLNDFYNTNFNHLSTDMKDQLKKTQNLANKLEKDTKSQENDLAKKDYTTEIFDTDLDATKEQENKFNKAFNQLMKYNNTQMKILKPYMNKRYAILQDIDKKITKQIKNKSTGESIKKLTEERDLLRKQCNSYKKTVYMLKKYKTDKKSLDDNVKQLDAKIKKLHNNLNKDFSNSYNPQINENNSLISDIDNSTSERNELNNTIFKMTNIELKTSE
jgi:uncharacterized protein (DUF885 family)